ncbi:hypothetical protein BGZ61DRAFT_138180 [Ilyonectria robusta]|uniref:uncharacterized protein n=1 Tax=Ilyonectria robusta TaxID=1079257 RepID=UPI001E8DC18F|nr:uncharacterized protein BGZ61DRAFT_138180 [Ilyonectria robusta]KAH8735303.1 hypothetical protein BGZ61DRAFT_138180 [Ilyonectria robusta]
MHAPTQAVQQQPHRAVLPPQQTRIPQLPRAYQPVAGPQHVQQAQMPTRTPQPPTNTIQFQPIVTPETIRRSQQYELAPLVVPKSRARSVQPQPPQKPPQVEQADTFIQASGSDSSFANNTQVNGDDQEQEDLALSDSATTLTELTNNTSDGTSSELTEADADQKNNTSPSKSPATIDG